MFAIPFALLVEQIPFADEQIGHFDGRFHQPTPIAPQIQNNARHPLSLQIIEGIRHLATAFAAKPCEVNVPYRRLVGQQARNNRRDENIAPHNGNLHGFSVFRQTHRQAHRCPFFAAHHLGNFFGGQRGGNSHAIYGQQNMAIHNARLGRWVARNRGQNRLARFVAANGCPNAAKIAPQANLFILGDNWLQKDGVGVIQRSHRPPNQGIAQFFWGWHLAQKVVINQLPCLVEQGHLPASGRGNPRHGLVAPHKSHIVVGKVARQKGDNGQQNRQNGDDNPPFAF